MKEVAATNCGHIMNNVTMVVFVMILLWSPASPSRRETLDVCLVCGYNSQEDKAKPAFKLKVRPLWAVKGQNLGLNVSFLPGPGVGGGGSWV